MLREVGELAEVGGVLRSTACVRARELGTWGFDDFLAACLPLLDALVAAC